MTIRVSPVSSATLEVEECSSNPCPLQFDLFLPKYYSGAMPYPLGDITIGDFPITQAFGEDKERYKALFNSNGHDGIDIGCPSMTPILAAAGGYIKECGFDAGGYGNYIYIVHDGYRTVYAHLNDMTVRLHDRVIAGQLIGHSNNTGFSSGPHLHFGVMPCDGAGNKTENNDTLGYIDPNGSRCEWNIQNLTAPINPFDVKEDPLMNVKSSDFTRMVQEGSSYKVIASFLLNHGLNGFLQANSKPPISLDHPDPENGNHINMFLAQLLTEMGDMDKKIKELEYQRVSMPIPRIGDQEFAEETINKLPIDQKNNILKNIISTLSGFIFKQ
jgi:hypothetical protein